MNIYKAMLHFQDKTNGEEINAPEYFEAENLEDAERKAQEFAEEIVRVEQDLMLIGSEVEEEPITENEAINDSSYCRKFL